MCVAPHVALLTCKGAHTDEPWAIATWKSLQQVGEAEGDDD